MTLAVVRAFREHAVLIAVVIAQSLDTLTFLPAVTRVGIEAERNILVRHLYVSYGPAGPILLKLAAIAVLVAALLWIRSRFPKAVPLLPSRSPPLAWSEPGPTFRPASFIRARRR